MVHFTQTLLSCKLSSGGTSVQQQCCWNREPILMQPTPRPVGQLYIFLPLAMTAVWYVDGFITSPSDGTFYYYFNGGA